MKLLLVLLINVVAILATTSKTPERIYTPYVLNNRNNGVLINTLTPGHSVGPEITFPTSHGSSFGQGQSLTVVPNYNGGISPCSSSGVITSSNQGCGGVISGGGHTIQRVPIQITKQVPVKSTRVVPMVASNVHVAPEASTDNICPIGSHLVNEVCEEINSTPTCAYNFEWNGKRCIAISKTCPENHKLINDSCVPEFMCPPNYTPKDNVCHPPKLPTPQCSNNFKWNGEYCEIAQTFCRYGVLKNGKCEQENYDCPAGFNISGNQCIKKVPFCPTGYTMMTTGLCTKTTHRCPQDSSSYNNQCIKMEHHCPAGTILNGNQCIAEEISFNTIYETKYVDQVFHNRVNVNTCQTGMCETNSCTSNTCVQHPCPLNTCLPVQH
ncbi:unnamed protein product [Diamesa tonsa]